MVRLTVKQQYDIWIAVAQSLKTAEELLRHSSVTVILKVNNKVEKWEIGLHDPPSRVLGMHHFIELSQSSLSKLKNHVQFSKEIGIYCFPIIPFF